MPTFNMEVDYNLGRILDAIKEAGVDSNTIVILTGDNAAKAVPMDRGGAASVQVMKEARELQA